MKTVVTLIIGIFILFSAFVYIYMILITIAGVRRAIRKWLRKRKIDRLRQHLADNWLYVEVGNTDVDRVINNRNEIIYSTNGMLFTENEWCTLLDEAHQLWISKWK